MAYLDELLLSYTSDENYPFHMPGHKRQALGMDHPENYDITEIDGFDNLHHPQDILLEAQQRAAKLHGARESFFLVNGSTAGILTAICASLPRTGTLLMARNSHKAAYHGAELAGAVVEYLYPMETDVGILGSIDPEDVAAAFAKDNTIKAVFITSPTYDGVVSDIEKIAEITHKNGAILIVDEAHGAHFGFSYQFPEKATRLGADLVIESLHKTLPSFTQTALLHRCSQRISSQKLRHYLSVFQTSSPSYLFMAGMDRCHRLLKEQGPLLFANFQTNLMNFMEDASILGNLRLLPAYNADEAYKIRGIFARDPSKLVILCQGTSFTGQALMDRLRRDYQLELEMCAPNYVTALTSIMDSDEGFRRLAWALIQLDMQTAAGQFYNLSTEDLYKPQPKALNIWQAAVPEAEEELEVPLEKSVDQTVLDYIYLYPPGIPVLVPGEIMTEQTLNILMQCKNQGYLLEGMADLAGEKIRIKK